MTIKRIFTIVSLKLAVLAVINAHGASSSGSSQELKHHAVFEVAAIKKAVFPSDDFFAGFAAAGGPCSKGNVVISGRRVTLNPVSLCGLISTAYDLRDSEIEGVPNWAKQTDSSLYYQIEATVPASEGDVTSGLAKDMLQSLLGDRFLLKAHREKRQLPVYALAIGPHGPKLTLRADGPCALASKSGQNPQTIFGGGSKSRTLAVCKPTMTMAQLVERLSRDSDRAIVDKTGIEGPQTFELEWNTDSGNQSNLPSLFSAVEEQLGLRLQAAKATADILVVESIQRPTAN